MPSSSICPRVAKTINTVEGMEEEEEEEFLRENVDLVSLDLVDSAFIATDYTLSLRSTWHKQQQLENDRVNF